jgi:hypothetical protein
MKTSVILNSSDRELFGTIIKQDTKTQMLSVSDLQKAYETARWQYGWGEKRISELLTRREIKERLFYLIENQGVIKTDLTDFMEMTEREGIVKVLKGLGLYKTTGARNSKTIMCDPYIWVLLAMEMNPMIYAKVVMWLTDSLIFNRIEAGTLYQPMNKAIKSIIDNPDYAKFAKLINHKVFGTHITGMRNLANSKELKKISKIEENITTAIEMNWIKNESELIEAINKL